MPGLTLTLEQARRLWSLDTATCHDALASLVDAGFLWLKPNGSYARASDLMQPDRPLRMGRVDLQAMEVKRPA